MIDKMFGKKFSRLIVLPVERKISKSYEKLYYCKCRCGRQKWITKSNLLKNKTKSCGCLASEKAKQTKNLNRNEFVDLINLRFGKLIVVSYKEKDNLNKCLWLCICDCGNEKIIKANNLQSGNTKSCGCIKSELIKNRHKDYRISKGKDPNIHITTQNILNRNTFHDSETYQKILKRDNYKCQFCPDVYENLEVHHILSWSKYPELRYEPANLITLCKICHIPIIHNGNIKIEPHEQTTKMLQDIVIKNEAMQ